MISQKIRDFYGLKKCKKVLVKIYKLYRRKKGGLDAASREKLAVHLQNLQRAILEKNVTFANQIAHLLEELSFKLMPKTAWDRIRQFTTNVGIALIVAILIRQMWFELYTIPTGSMRPTLKESDFLVVSKTNFGINMPLQRGHFYFDPSLVKRGTIFVFTSEGMDIPDSDINYFYLFPGKKQMVKRLVGKPGDTLYFYGGKIYGIDSSGRELKMLQEPSWMQDLEYIPFIRFDGKVETPEHPIRGIFPSAFFYQMNEPVAKMELTQFGKVTGQMLPIQGNSPLPHFFDLWGFQHFAMARLLNASEMRDIHPGILQELESASLYLELTHHPDLKGQLIRDLEGRVRPDLKKNVSILPLQKEHLKTLMQHMTTCRFEVYHGLAARHGWNVKDQKFQSFFPKLEGVPNGTYEFQNGKAYKIYFGGISKELPANHPLYQMQNVKLLYNLGIEFFKQYTPKKQSPLPSRYAYFRNGSLYLLGHPIVKKQDPALTLFLKREYQKQAMATSYSPYFPFEDLGPPLTADGELDVDFIRKFGLKIPARSYLALGDNHAMSGDSRQFGFVPEANLKGSARFLFWPPGSRWGLLPEPSYSFFALPNALVWTLAILCILLYSFYSKRKWQKPMNLS